MASGHIVQVIHEPGDPGLVLFDVELAPVNNMLYVLWRRERFHSVIVHMNLRGRYPGLDHRSGQRSWKLLLRRRASASVPRDGSFWIPQPNSRQHHPPRCRLQLRLPASLSPIGAHPESAAVGPDGNVYFTQVESGGSIVSSIPQQRSINFFASSPFPENLTSAPSRTAIIWVGDIRRAASEEFDSSGNLS